MLWVRSPYLKTLAFFSLMCLGGLMAGNGGCERPEARTRVNVPVVAKAEAVPADEMDTLAQYRLARDSELSRQHESLLNLLATAKSDESVRGEAEKELWRLTRVEAAEHEAEAVLAIQGWPGACVTIVGDEAAVVVPGLEITVAEAAAIGRLVAKATGIDEAGVRILERR